MEHFQENQNDLKRMEMLRAALPYIPVSMQKFLSIYIGWNWHSVSKVLKCSVR